MREMRLEAWESGQWTCPLGGCVRVETVEVWVKRVKHVGNEEETYEGASNNAVVRTVGCGFDSHPGQQIFFFTSCGPLIPFTRANAQ